MAIFFLLLLQNRASLRSCLILQKWISATSKENSHYSPGSLSLLLVYDMLPKCLLCEHLWFWLIFYFFLFYCFALWHLRLSDLRYYSFDGTISSSLRAINVICAGRLLVRFKFVKQPLLKLTDYHNASCTVYKHPSILWMHNWDYQTVRPA